MERAGTTLGRDEQKGFSAGSFRLWWRGEPVLAGSKELEVREGNMWRVCSHEGIKTSKYHSLALTLVASPRHLCVSFVAENTKPLSL